MRQVLVAIAALVMLSPPSFAGSLTIKFINQSGQVINSIMATPKGGDQPITINTAPMATLAKATLGLNADAAQAGGPVMPPILVPPANAKIAVQAAQQAPTLVKPTLTPPIIPTPTAVVRVADPSAVTFTVPDKVCVFNLTFTLASGKVTTLPDTDLCQTEQVIVQ